MQPALAPLHSVGPTLYSTFQDGYNSTLCSHECHSHAPIPNGCLDISNMVSSGFRQRIIIVTSPMQVLDYLSEVRKLLNLWSGMRVWECVS